MARTEPYEPAPHLAVAVSGGADSMALCLLAARWAQERGGSVTALTVDHRLRPGSAGEARQVGEWLAARGIAHRVLPRRGPRPARNVQAAAREARYALLLGWCRRRGVLHLLLAHHCEDQAETLLLRLGRGSGVDGLAAMPAATERSAARIVRPLLPVPRDRLRATLAALGQRWLEDPSNEDAAYARVALRRGRATFEAVGLACPRLAETAARVGESRALLEQASARLMAEAVSLDPAGYARIDLPRLAAAPAPLGRRILHGVVTTVGGSAYGPRAARLVRAYAGVIARDRRGRTLGGCRLIIEGDTLLVCREASACAADVALAGSREVTWDGRFRVRLAPAAARAARGWRLGRLGAGTAPAARPDGHLPGVPPAARASLPALRDETGVRCVPHLGYGREEGDVDILRLCETSFRPERALDGGRFAVANWPNRPI